MNDTPDIPDFKPDKRKLSFLITEETESETIGQLLNLRDKALFSIAGSASQMGCQEHADPIAYIDSIEITGLVIFLGALDKTAREILVENVKLSPRNLTQMMVTNANQYLRNIVKYTETAKGFSPVAKKKFIRDLKDWLGQTVGKNIPNYNTAYDTILKST
jgi:hypothetical protein